MGNLLLGFALKVTVSLACSLVDRDILPSPVVSDNVVLEDLAAVEDDMKYFEVEFEGSPSFSLRRGNRRGIKGS